MAKFNVDCPHCGGTAEVQEEWIGMEVECPYCRKSYIIPQNNAQEKKNLPKCPNCGHNLQPGAKFCSECGKDALDKLENWFGWISAGLWVGFIWIFVKCGLLEKLKLWSFVLVGAGTIFCAVLPYMVRKILSSVWRPSQEDVRKGIKLLSAILVAIMALGVGYWWASRPATPQSAAHRPAAPQPAAHRPAAPQPAAHRPAAPQAATPAATSQAPIASTPSQKKRVWVTFHITSLQMFGETPVVPAEFKFYVNDTPVSTKYEESNFGGAYLQLQKGDIVTGEAFLRNRMGAILKTYRGEKTYESGNNFSFNELDYVIRK